MRHFRIAASSVGIAFAMLWAGSLAAQEGGAPAAPLAGAAPHVTASLAEKLFQRGLGESRAAVIGAESVGFADRMAVIYLGGGEGASWREEVAQIHDPARVSGLLLAAIGQQLKGQQLEGTYDPRLLAAVGATGVDAVPDGQGMILAARIELARPGSLEAVTLRMRADDARADPVLAAIDEMIADTDPASAEMARVMNRQLAFAAGFAEGGGYDFPTSRADTAADLSLQVPELYDEAVMRIRLCWYAAYDPLGAAAVNRSAARRDSAAMRALNALIERAEDDVLEQLGAETGRAAARRMKGTPL